MPVTVAKRGNRYQVVEPSGRVARNAAGTPVKPGGHATRQAAEKQAAAINSPKGKKK